VANTLLELTAFPGLTQVTVPVEALSLQAAGLFVGETADAMSAWMKREHNVRARRKAFGGPASRTRRTPSPTAGSCNLSEPIAM